VVDYGTGRREMTILLSADFTEKLQKYFNEYADLEKALESWGLTPYDLPVRDFLRCIGMLRLRMERCRKNAQLCFMWDIGPAKELPRCISLLDTAAKGMNCDLGILSIT
jgi:hypothetical protein